MNRALSISPESTQNKQQYGAKITCTEAGGKVMIRNVVKKFGIFRVLIFSPPELGNSCTETRTPLTKQQNNTKHEPPRLCY